MNTKDNYIGFLDLFGVRELARSDRARYIDVLTDFRDKVDEALSESTNKPQVSQPEAYLFSDCIYYESPCLESILDFTSRLRHLLIIDAGEPTFFSAALGIGHLEPEELNSQNDRANGFVFGTHAAEVYCEQESLRGIGIRISDRLKHSMLNTGLENRLLNNAYLPKADSILPVPFTDLKLDPTSDLGREEIYSKCFKSLSDAATANPRFARNYIPLMVNLFATQDYKSIDDNITSLDIKKDNEIRDRLHRIRYFEEDIHVTDEETKYTEDSTNTRWHPYNAFRRGWFTHYKDKIPGYEIIYLATISKIFEKNNTNTPNQWTDQEQMILQTVVDDPNILNYIHRVPPAILPHKTRNRIMLEASKRNYDR